MKTRAGDRRAALMALALVLSLAASAAGQSVGERIKQKAAERAGQRTDAAIDKALDRVECVFTDTECIANAKKTGTPVDLKDEDGNPVDEKGQPRPPEAAKPAAGPQASAPSAAWANYDFVPGNRVLFADDFAADRIGNFPQRLELGAGSMELVEWEGKRLIRSNDNGFLVINLPDVLPQKFTLEAEVIPGSGTGWGEPVIAFSGPASVSTSGDLTVHADENNLSYVVFSEHEVGLRRQAVTNTVHFDEEMEGKLFHLRIMADGNYVKVFVNEKRVANVPNANLGRSNKIYIGLNAEDERPAFIGNISVAAGGRDLYDALTADGRVATQGILFDTGSDRIRPESGATLKTIGEMLRQHADLQLMIEGHTDNVGAAASNKSLSERRAAAVKQYLVANFGIAVARLSSSGFGDTKPAAPNTTPEGRQQNRRVELVKM